jgi:hypothetical protein
LRVPSAPTFNHGCRSRTNLIHTTTWGLDASASSCSAHRPSHALRSARLPRSHGYQYHHGQLNAAYPARLSSRPPNHSAKQMTSPTSPPNQQPSHNNHRPLPADHLSGGRPHPTRPSTASILSLPTENLPAPHNTHRAPSRPPATKSAPHAATTSSAPASATPHPRSAAEETAARPSSTSTTCLCPQTY